MTAAVGGFLHRSGKLRSLTGPRRQHANEVEYGRVCPHCCERFSLEVFEFHLLLAHGKANGRAI